MTPEQASRIATKLGFRKGKLHSAAVKQITLLYEMFWQNDCTLLEINPFCETHDGEVTFFHETKSHFLGYLYGCQN